MERNGKINAQINILFSCVGRRVGLINCFRNAAEQLGIGLGVYGCDAEPLSPALYTCDEYEIVTSVFKDSYIDHILSLVEKWNINLIIPTIDTELPVLAENRERFKQAGCTVLVSSPEAISTCNNKFNTYKALAESNIGTPHTWLPEDALALDELKYPCILKPAHGSASRGIHKAYSRDDLGFFINRYDGLIVQEFIKGEEYTCDVFVDRNQQPRCCVPRKRIETRGGEVSKSKVVKRQDLIDAALKTVTALGCEFGVITVQELLSENGEIMIFDINPRFGGGIPLAIKAGANFPGWILQSITGDINHDQIDYYNYRDGLVMLRYDSEIWV